jgi:CHAT domain-containing protein
MAEQRIQAYMGLIQQLLGCDQGEEGVLLQANAELVDAGLVAMMGQVADQMESQWQGNAGWLRQFAAQLTQILGLRESSSLSTASEITANFMMEIVQLISQTKGDQAKIYGLFRANLDRLDEMLLSVLPRVFRDLVQQNSPSETAAIFVEFGNLIQQFPLGRRMVNLEISIAAYEQALQILTRDSFPTQWATTQNNLANAYKNRIKGERAGNLEKAIASYEQSLQIRTRDASPEQWAMTQNNLANAYLYRIRGDRADNLEQAITFYDKALRVLTRDSFPEGWAMTQNNLAATYKDRIRGNRVDNIELAIEAYQLALQVRTHETFPEQWAATQNNLANAYAERIQGERAENVEQAITAYHQALIVRTKAAMPIEWAITTMNLATAYSNRIKGDRADNIEEAIVAYQNALTVMTIETMPIEWATTTMNLATAYSNRIKGDRADNIEEAIVAYQNALTVRTEVAMPIEWAQTTMNLANAYYSRIKGDRAESIELAISAYMRALMVRTQASMPIEWAQTIMNLAAAYSNRIRGDRAENIDQAINTYERALMVRTQANMPIEWAQTTMNLATAYSNRIRGDRAENIEQAVNAYKRALTVMTQALPDDCRKTGRLLANLYSDQTRWTEATSTYQIALQAAEICYQRSDFLDSKSFELSTTADLPRRAAYAYAKTGDLSKAIETLEQGRARGLSESLSRDQANLIQLEQINPDLYNYYKTLTEQLRNLETQQRNPDSPLTRPEVQTSRQTLRQQLQDAIDQIRQVPSYEEFLQAPTFEDIQRAVMSTYPFIYLVTTPNGSMALTLTVDAIEVLWLDDLTETWLNELLQNWFDAYGKSQDDRQGWYDAIDTTTNQLWDLIMAPLVQQLQTKGIDRITLIPTGNLSLLPLHAAWTSDLTEPTGRRYALDDIHITYAPNAKSLTAAQTIANRIQPTSILAIDNPSQDLPNSHREIDSAINGFPHHTILRHQQATIETVKIGLKTATIAHFSCHGTADLNSPLNSGLLMSDGLLTLKDILALNLTETGGLRLAILSACETGIIGLDNADEAISLPTGLLQSGVAGVIASLWSVSDLSTMMMLKRFYDLWRKDGLEPSIALRQAQQWMIHTTDGEKADELGFQILAIDRAKRTYAHPFHWAAFSYIGV